MAAKIRIIWDNRLLEAATLTAASSATSFPLANLKDKLRKRTWRSTSITGQYIIVDFGSPVFCQCLALINHNLTFTGQITVQASSLAAFSNLLMDEDYDAWSDIIGFGEMGFGQQGYGGMILESDRKRLVPEPIRIIYFDPTPEPVEARYWKIAFTDTANPDGYLEAGRLYLCGYDEYQRQFGYEWGYGGIDDSNIERSIGGQAWTDIIPLRRTLRLPWNAFSGEDKYWRFLYFLRQVGLSKDFIIDPMPDGRASARFFTIMYGRFSNIPEMKDVTNKYSELELEFEEAL